MVVHAFTKSAWASRKKAGSSQASVAEEEPESIDGLTVER
jgi:hypothetical protein